MSTEALLPDALLIKFSSSGLTEADRTRIVNNGQKEIVEVESGGCVYKLLRSRLGEGEDRLTVCCPVDREPADPQRVLLVPDDVIIELQNSAGSQLAQDQPRLVVDTDVISHVLRVEVGALREGDPHQQNSIDALQLWKVAQVSKLQLCM